jgi:hypothetical protein
MKYLKKFEEVSPEYIQGKIAGKPDSPQKDRLQKAANKMTSDREFEENQKKSKQQEEERMKSPEYAKAKELANKRFKLADDFRDEKLKLYFAPISGESVEGKGCFELSCKFLISTDCAGYDWYDLSRDSFEHPKEEFAPFLGSIVLEEGNFGEFNNYKRIQGPEVLIKSPRENYIEFIITKEGIQILGDGIGKMETISGKIANSFEYDKAKSFTGLKLVGMDAASKNKLANFIKQYASGANTGNNNLKVNGLQMPVFNKNFTYEKFEPLDLKHNSEIDPNIPTEPEQVQTTAKKDESPESKKDESPESKKTLGGKVKSFLGFGK